MIPTGDMTMDEAKRTLDLFVTEVKPQLELQPAWRCVRGRCGAAIRATVAGARYARTNQQTTTARGTDRPFEVG